MLHLAGLKASGHTQPETAHGELTQPEVTEPIPVCTRGSGTVQPELVPYLQVTHVFQHVSCFLL